MKQKYKNTIAFLVVATVVYMLAAMFIIQGETLTIGFRIVLVFFYLFTAGLLTALFYSDQD